MADLTNGRDVSDEGGRGWENTTCLAWESWLSVALKFKKIIDIPSGGCKARTTRPSLSWV